MSTIIKIIIIMIAAPVIGCLYAGIDRKLTARLQHRVGPPLLQPFYDVRKLFSKENIAVSKFQNIYVIIYFAFVAASLIMLYFETDLLMILFVFTIANVAFIVGGSCTGSPYGKIGSQREIMAMLCYEPILIFFIMGMYMLTGSFRVSSVNLASQPLLLYMPLIFIAMLFTMIIKFKKSPFDFSTSHHAHQELVKGITTEFSGPALGIIEVTHWYESVFLLSLMIIFWRQNLVIGILLTLFVFLFLIIMDNITARMTWQWMLKATWFVVIGLCIINLVAIYYFKIKLV
jgi:ech hydrogenase subunit B